MSRLRREYTKRAESLRGCTVAVSGSTGGLGRALCLHLARAGASLLMLDRREERVRSLIEEIRREVPSLSAEWIYTDLADLQTVRATVERLKETPPDYLILNAGVYHVARFITPDGWDNVFQINFVAPYLMARSLAPIIGKRGGRIVAVGSIAHRYSKSDPSDPQFLTKKSSALVYGNAKRYLMAALSILAEGGAPITVAHPGITLTGITAHYPKPIYALIKHPMRVIFMSPSKASLSILGGFWEECPFDSWIGPRFLDVWGAPRVRRLRSVRGEERNAIGHMAEEVYRYSYGRKTEKK